MIQFTRGISTSPIDDEFTPYQANRLEADRDWVAKIGTTPSSRRTRAFSASSTLPVGEQIFFTIYHPPLDQLNRNISRGEPLYRVLW